MAGLQMPNETRFGLGIQQGGGGQGVSDYLKMALGYEHVVSNNDNFSYFPLTDVGISPVKTMGTLPPEIGGRALATGAYATGTWAAGPVTMIPRLDNRLGWLLLAGMGDVSTVADTKAENLAILGGVHGADAGINSHIFQFNIDDQYFVPWLTLRRLLPHSTTALRLGETFQDGKMATFTLTATAGAPLQVDVDFLARLKQSNYIFDFDPSWGTFVNDDFDKFGVTSCDGHFNVEDVAFDVTAVTITVGNILLPPTQSIIIGTTHPVDFPNLNRTMTVTASFLVSTWDFYVSTFAGSAVTATDSNVECAVYKADIDVMLASQVNITGSEPYRIRILSNPNEDNAAWTVQPVRIMPNRPVVVQANCTVLALEGSSWENHPVFIVLQNDKADYNLPTP